MSQAVEQVKSRLDLVEFLARYLSLKKAGSSYKGLSPFNPEKTPSFVVNPDKGVWYDFSAGFGGDIFDFVMRIEGVDFYQALKQLAEIAGVEIEPTLISKGKQVESGLARPTDTDVRRGRPEFRHQRRASSMRGGYARSKPRQYGHGQSQARSSESQASATRYALYFSGAGLST